MGTFAHSSRYTKSFEKVTSLSLTPFSLASPERQPEHDASDDPGQGGEGEGGPAEAVLDAVAGNLGHRDVRDQRPRSIGRNPLEEQKWLLFGTIEFFLLYSVEIFLLFE